MIESSGLQAFTEMCGVFIFFAGFIIVIVFFGIFTKINRNVGEVKSLLLTILEELRNLKSK
jgi:hypothetical protein